MSKWVWFNPYLPQTLQIAVSIGYFRGVLYLVFGSMTGLSSITTILFIAAMILASFGMANLRLWGYILAFVVLLYPYGQNIYDYISAGVPVTEYLSSLIDQQSFIGTIIDIAIFVALIHPMSTSFVKGHFEKKIP